MILSFITSVVCLFHPIHVSVTEIEYDEKERELEIITRIFTDDFETAIRASRKMPELDLLNPSAGLTTDLLVKEYLMEHLSISLDGKAQRLNYLGFEDEGDALVCYVQVSPVKKWKTIMITNRVLLDIYDDQSNLVHVTLSGKVRSLRLMKNNPSGTITF
jgi:hypothetical protein